MPEVREGLYSLNAGEISRTALARIDLAKLRMACERQENFLPLVLGPAMLRPGTQFLARGQDDLPATLIEFKKDEDAIALWLLYEGGIAQVFDATTETFVVRPAVSAAITNGDFTSGLAGWTNASETGASITTSGGFLALLGTGFNYAYARQTVATSSPGLEHGLHILINRGDVAIRIGSFPGGGDYWNIEVPEGEYSLAFVPSGTFYVQLGGHHDYFSLVDSVQIDPPGRLRLNHPWTIAGDLNKLQHDQSQDVIFVACDGRYQQRRLERRNELDMRSWAIALYRADDGPFRTPNLGSTTITPSGTSGFITVSASRPLFQPGHVNALFRLTQGRQEGRAILAGPNQATDPVRVSGISGSRTLGFNISGLGNTGSGNSTITLQSSFSDPGNWINVNTYNADGLYSYLDGLDNQIIWYRLIALTSGYSGDFPTAVMVFPGSQDGIIRIATVTNELNATANVLKHLGDITATSDWAEGEWSFFRGWPIAVALHDGRLFWQCELRDQGSISDAFLSFDDTQLGDSAPINRTTVQSRPHWMISALRLLIGTTLQEISVRASAFDEPLTATAFTPRPCSDRGSMQMRAVNIDGRVIFVGRDERRVFLLNYDAGRGDFIPLEITRLKQEMCAPGVVDMAAQRQPDTRIYLALSDGRLVVVVHEPNEDVSALVSFTFSGDAVERVACLPAIEEDKVYLYVRRGTARCLERFAKRSEAAGGLLSKTVDSHVVYQGPLTTVIGGLGHLEGRSVVVWADSNPLITQTAPLTVSGGSVTLPAAAGNVVVGLAYDGMIKTAKLAHATQNGTSLAQQKRVGPIGFVMTDVAWKGVRIGRDFEHMTALPATYRGRPLLATEVLSEWDQALAAFNGGWGSDPRICIKAQSPYSCTLMGIVFGEQANSGEDLPPPRGR